MGTEHFAEGAGGNAAGDAVDVDLLVLMLLTHGLLLLHLWDWSAAHTHTHTLVYLAEAVMWKLCSSVEDLLIY